MDEGKQVRIEPESHERLKEISELSGVPMATIISRLVDKHHEDVIDSLKQSPSMLRYVHNHNE